MISAFGWPEVLAVFLICMVFFVIPAALIAFAIWLARRTSSRRKSTPPPAITEDERRSGLRELKALFDAGLISKEVYEEKQRELFRSQ